MLSSIYACAVASAYGVQRRSMRAALVGLALALAVLLELPGLAGAEPLGALAEFPIATGGAPAGIAAGPDGNIWFTEYGLGFDESIGRISPSGHISEFPIPSGGSGAASISQGPDGNMWFTEYTAGVIGQITPAGHITEFPLPGAAGPNGIAAGPDGNVWFTETAADAIGRITPSGEVTTFPVPSAGAGPVGIAEGPDGNMWFTEFGFGSGEKIARITPTGQVTEFPLTAGSGPYSIAPGPEGDMWFTENTADAIGRIDPASGQITTTPIPTERARPRVIAPGPDGSMWFTEYGSGGVGQNIGRITPSGEIGEYATPTTESGPYGIAPGPDGNMWFTEYSRGIIGQIGAGAPGAAAVVPSITGDRRATFPQTCNAGSWNSLLAQQPLTTLFGFDGYHWTLEGTVVGAGPTYTPSFAQEGHKLYCVQTVTYPLPTLLSDSTTSAPVTVIAPPPTLARVGIHPAIWSEGHPARPKGKQHPTPVGTFISFVMNEAAPIAFDFEQRVAGRREGDRCEAPTPENARRKPCLRTITVASHSLTGQMGSNHVYFQGAITTRRNLKPGHYKLVIVAANTTGAAKPVSLPITVTP